MALIFFKGGERSDAVVFFVTIGLTTIKISISEKGCSKCCSPYSLYRGIFFRLILSFGGWFRSTFRKECKNYDLIILRGTYKETVPLHRQLKLHFYGIGVWTQEPPG